MELLFSLAIPAKGALSSFFSSSIHCSLCSIYWTAASSPHLDTRPCSYWIEFMLNHIFCAVKISQISPFEQNHWRFSADCVYVLRLAGLNLWTTVGKPWGGCSEAALCTVSVVYEAPVLPCGGPSAGLREAFMSNLLSGCCRLDQ